nr:hypothetical protein [uncultured Agathobaculum sp.]
MANWTGVITNAGNECLSEWVNEKTLNFDSAAAGQGTVATAGMLAQTALVNQKQIASIIGADRVSTGIRLKIRITAPQAAYTLNQYGVWASITGGSTTMIALFQHEKGIPIPSAAESPDFVYTFYALISTSNTGKWTVNIDTSASVTLEEMNAAIATAVATKEGVIKDASEKDSLVDADCIAVVDSADGGKTKRVLWSTVKAALAKLFVPLTRKINGKTLSSDVTLTGEDIKVSASSSTTIYAALAPLGGATTAQGIVDALGALLAVAAAAAYDPEGSYAVGDYCTHGGKLHKCGTPIESGEAWNAAHWTETTVAEELNKRLNEEILPLVSGYAGTATYMKTQEGIVFVRINNLYKADGSNLPFDGQIATLPEDCRPTSEWTTGALVGDGAYIKAACVIIAYPNGIVKIAGLPPEATQFAKYLTSTFFLLAN